MPVTETAVISNLREAFITFNGLCGGRAESFPGVTCVLHPSRLTGFNMAFLHGAEGTEGRALGRVQGFFREINTDWCLVVPPRLTGLFDAVTKRVRISERRAVPQMVLDPRGVSVPGPPATLEVRPVKTVRIFGRGVAPPRGDSGAADGTRSGPWPTRRASRPKTSPSTLV